MFELGSFNLIKEFDRASNEPNAEQFASSSAGSVTTLFKENVHLK